MKKFWIVFGWVFLGIFLQFKYNVLYGIVFLENLNFHDRAYFIKMDLSSTEESIRVLRVETTVHHSLGSHYFANVYIPENYKVLNNKPYLGAASIPGYKAYQMDMKRKYRDVISKKDFLIIPEKISDDIKLTPILVHFENMDQLLHKDNTYQLTTNKKNTRLEGPETVEKTYPQKLGM